MNDLELIGLQLRTLFRLDHRGRLLAEHEPGNRTAPRLFVGRTLHGTVATVRHDLDPSLASRLLEIAATEPPADDLRDPPAYAPRYEELLGSPFRGGPAYMFPSDVAYAGNAVEVTDPDVLRRRFPAIADDLEARRPVLAALEDGQPAAICHCARRTTEAAEAGLFTIEALRKRGYGVAATGAWAAAVRRMGLLPLYSTSWENEASQGVARRLGLVAYGADWSID